MNVVGLAGGYDEAERTALAVAPGVELGREAAAKFDSLNMRGKLRMSNYPANPILREVQGKASASLTVFALIYTVRHSRSCRSNPLMVVCVHARTIVLARTTPRPMQESALPFRR